MFIRTSSWQRTVHWLARKTRHLTSSSSELGNRDLDIPSNVITLGVNKEKELKSLNAFAALENLKTIRAIKNCPPHRQPELIHIDRLEADFISTEAVELHPEVFASNPRIDFLHLCKEWQSKYKEVDYRWKPTRAEVGRGRKKPWVQKGTGRARHGSSVAPQWKGGGVAHGPRGPKALYQKILPQVRMGALVSALSVKFYQQDLHVVYDLVLSSPESEYLRNVLSERGITPSAVITYSEDDRLDENPDIYAAVEHWPQINLLPLVGLNVWSLLHHDKLVLTIKALEELEKKVLWNLHRYDWIAKPHNFYRDLPFKTA